MKKYILPALLLLSATTWAQTTPSSLYINLKNGSQIEYPIAEIENITFDKIDPIIPPSEAPVAFTVPASFESSYVQKVMNGDKQVAEIALEYIKSIDKQLTVVYPCLEDGKADLTKGIATTGATVVWNLENNTATVGEAADAVTSFYIVDGELTTTFSGTTVEGKVQPDLLVDVRGTESNTYRIVKVGTQYWMADNLRATRYADGSTIDGYAETDAELWKANTTGCYLKYGEKDWINLVGYLYSGYAVVNEKGIAPEGWEVPTQAQWSKLRTAGNLAMVNFKDSAPLSWATGGEGNNITGFSVIANGYYSTATELAALNTESYFWSSTKYRDSLVRADVLDYARFTATGKNMVVSTTITGGHSLEFGHAIRLVRK